MRQVPGDAAATTGTLMSAVQAVFSPLASPKLSTVSEKDTVCASDADPTRPLSESPRIRAAPGANAQLEFDAIQRVEHSAESGLSTGPHLRQDRPTSVPEPAHICAGTLNAQSAPEAGASKNDGPMLPSPRPAQADILAKHGVHASATLDTSAVAAQSTAEGDGLLKTTALQPTTFFVYSRDGSRKQVSVDESVVEVT